MSAEKPKDGDVCRICSKSLSGKFFFIELPIEDQLQTIVAQVQFYNACTCKDQKHPINKSTIESYVQDYTSLKTGTKLSDITLLLLKC